MNSKNWIWLGVFIGSSVGGWLPTLFGQDWLSGWGIIGSAIGGILGIWAGYKLGEQLS